MITAVTYATFAVAKRKAEKIQASTGFDPLTSAIPVQRSINFKMSNCEQYIYAYLFTQFRAKAKIDDNFQLKRLRNCMCVKNKVSKGRH